MRGTGAVVFFMLGVLLLKYALSTQLITGTLSFLSNLGTAQAQP
jgi:hypothetical protein